jgi:hypothetical protein
VPFSVGNSDLRIVASQPDLGPLGPKEGRPTTFAWRWYYSLPMLPLWALIAVLLVAVRANRHPPAWLILIPLGEVVLVWQMLMTLLGVSDEAAEMLRFFVESLAIAWTAVWLVGHWLAGRSRRVAMLLMMVAMTVVGLLSTGCYHAGITGHLDSVLGFDLIAMILPLAMLWTSYSCGRNFTRARFRGRLFVRMAVPLVALASCYVVVLGGMLSGDIAHGSILAAMLLIMAFVYAGLLYLLNWPFLELAFRSSFYEDRFQRLFHIETGEPAVNGAPQIPASRIADAPAADA